MNIIKYSDGKEYEKSWGRDSKKIFLLFLYKYDLFPENLNQISDISGLVDRNRENENC